MGGGSKGSSKKRPMGGLTGPPPFPPGGDAPPAAVVPVSQQWNGKGAKGKGRKAKNHDTDTTPATATAAPPPDGDAAPPPPPPAQTAAATSGNGWQSPHHEQQGYYEQWSPQGYSMDAPYNNIPQEHDYDYGVPMEAYDGWGDQPYHEGYPQGMHAGYGEGGGTYSGYDAPYDQMGPGPAEGIVYEGTPHAVPQMQPAHIEPAGRQAKGRKRGAAGGVAPKEGGGAEGVDGRHAEQQQQLYSREQSRDDGWGAHPAYSHKGQKGAGKKGSKGYGGKRWSGKDHPRGVKGKHGIDTEEGGYAQDAALQGGDAGYVAAPVDHRDVPGVAGTETGGYEAAEGGESAAWFRQAACVVEDVVERFSENCLPAEVPRDAGGGGEGGREMTPVGTACLRDFRRFVQYLATCYREQGPLDLGVFSQLCERFVAEWPTANLAIDTMALGNYLSEVNLVQWSGQS